MSGTLYVVATPIGNLEDLSPRARQTLADVDLIAAEDTRHTGRLLSHFGVKTRLLALHDHNEADRVSTVIDALQSGESVALVSDAGTPLISDPGYRLVKAAHAAGIAVSPIAGPSAVTAALSAAGLPTDRFCFEGFLPAKQKARRDAVAALAAEPRTMVFFESVHRISPSLQDLAAAFGTDRPAFLAREMTKLHEQCLNATLGELAKTSAAGGIAEKGEIVIVVAGATGKTEVDVDIDRLLLELKMLVSSKDAARVVANATGKKRNQLYQRLLELEQRDANES